MPGKVVVILGMHRSGTSLVTSSLPLLGYTLGDNLMPPAADNPRGFYEDRDVVALNDELLAINSSSWGSPLSSLKGETTASAELEEQAGRILRQRLADSGRWVMKDPRLCLLMPFWQSRFEEAGVEFQCVLVQRNPVDIAESLKSRNRFTIRHGLLLTYVYYRSVLDFLGDSAFVISYDRFLDSPGTEIERLANYLAVEMDPGSVAGFIETSLDSSLRHHRSQSPIEQFAALETLNSLMLELSDGVEASAAGKRHLLVETPGLVTELLEIQVERDFGLVGQLTGKAQALEAQIKLLEADVSDRSRILEEREKHVQVLDAEVDRLGRELAKSVNAVHESERALGETRRQKESELNAVNERLNAVHSTVRHQAKEISDLGDTIETLYQRDAENQNRIKELNNHLDDFDRVHMDLLNSVSFRLGRLLTYPIRKLFQSLVVSRLEPGSFWMKIIGFLRNCLSHPVATLKLVSLARLKNFYLLLTRRQDLADQVLANYDEVFQEEEKQRQEEKTVHHYTNEQLDSYQLALPTSAEPRISVVIPVYNQLDHTLHCLESIAENPPCEAFEVVVADDASTDRTAEVLGRITGLTVISNDHNLRFVLNCNQAISHCRGQFVYLLNNDTAVQPGWLDSLIHVFEQYPEAGLVGSKLIYPDGRLQEAGGIVWQDASAWNYGRLQDPDLPEFNYLREVDYVSGAGIMFRRQDFEDLGGFDEQLAPAYYEDTDLAFRIREAGLKVYYQPLSCITHYEGISHGTDESSGLKQNQIVNRDKFFAKWRQVLEAENYINGENVMRARDRSRSKSSVLVIDHYVPHFDKDAGSRSTFFYLKLLSTAGCQVKVLGDNFFKHEPYTSELQALGIEVLYGRQHEKNWKGWLQRHAGELDVIYLMRPHITGKYIDVINQLQPKPRTIYFGHDLHYLRIQRQAEIVDDGSLKKEALTWKQKEFELFRKVDRIYYPSQVEVDEILGQEPSLPVKAIPLYVFDDVATDQLNFSNRSGILFVGGFNHPPNVDGLDWFVKDVLPQVSINNSALNIVGSNMPDEISSLAAEGITVHGFLSDEALAALYSKVRLVVVPLRFGAGIKGKVLEAMSLGVPVVTTSVGAEGIPEAGRTLLIEDDAYKMADTISVVYNDHNQLSALSEKGRHVIRDYFSSDAALAAVSEDFLINR